MRQVSIAAVLLGVVLVGCNLVKDTTPPDVDLVYPAPWAALSMEPVILKADAYDAGGLAQVVFFADGDTVESISEAPFRAEWTPAAIGNHTLCVHAADDAGNVTRPDPIVVTVYQDTDSVAPFVMLTAPSEWQVITGPTALKAEAADDNGVSRVVFLVDGDSLATDTGFPYEVTWDASAAEVGNHSLFCRAHDMAGNVGVSELVYVTVPDTSDRKPPVVEIVRPAMWSTVSDTVVVEAIASDEKGVARVTFYLDGDSVATVVSEPYRFDWNSHAAANGSHTVYARAWDPAGNRGQSSVVTFYVDNP